MLHEATVGAGLPVIDTHKKLAETGDHVLRVEGCVSGTLMFVLSEVCGGRPFSEAVLDAVARGYAEPDPRDDLSGQDAARKGLILARLLLRTADSSEYALVDARFAPNEVPTLPPGRGAPRGSRVPPAPRRPRRRRPPSRDGVRRAHE